MITLVITNYNYIYVGTSGNIYYEFSFDTTMCIYWCPVYWTIVGENEIYILPLTIVNDMYIDAL